MGLYLYESNLVVKPRDVHYVHYVGLHLYPPNLTSNLEMLTKWTYVQINSNSTKNFLDFLVLVSSFDSNQIGPKFTRWTQFRLEPKHMHICISHELLVFVYCVAYIYTHTHNIRLDFYISMHNTRLDFYLIKYLRHKIIDVIYFISNK